MKFLKEMFVRGQLLYRDMHELGILEWRWTSSKICEWWVFVRTNLHDQVF
jgi:hypothetical protein